MIGPGLVKCQVTDARRTALAQATLSLAVDTALLVRAAEELGDRALAIDLGAMVDRLNSHRVRLVDGTIGREIERGPRQ